jgi:hypothetical protein
MFRSLFIPFLAVAFLAAPAALPSSFAPAIAPGLSGSAQAATTVNSSRSNTYRTKKRMGGGGGTSTKRPKSKALNPQPEPPGRY